VPTEKRARQKAARKRKRAAQARRVRTRKRLRSGAFILGGGAVVLVVALAATGQFSGGPAAKSKGKSTSTSTTSTTLSAAQAAAAQSAATAAATAAGCPTSTSARVNTLSWKAPPAETIDASKNYTATVKTTAGTFTIDLLAKTAPDTVNNFVFLADQGFYKCVIFQRVIPGFMDQTGDPTGTGSGGPGYEFANENVPKSYASFDVAMAHSSVPNSNGSQFFIIAPGGAAKLSPTYSLFGKVVSGQGVVEKINEEGNSTQNANGVPPKVVQRMLSVTISDS
jgi:cyclophilin family peptidyl-prolyl cis-trans isomerase